MQALATELLPPEQYRKLQRKSAVFSHGVYTRYPFQAKHLRLAARGGVRVLGGIFGGALCR